MSDDEMNIDEGTCLWISFSSLYCNILIFLPKWPTEVVLSGREAVVSKVPQVCIPALHNALL